MAKIKITQDPDSKWPQLIIDDAKIPYRSFRINCDPVCGINILEIHMFLKSGEIDIEGNVLINFERVDDEIGKQVYEILRPRYQENPTIKIPGMEDQP